ncbi:hypothetical protein TYRP_004739 [Tyrophagus putrescentiae]|nr:hypothetical protein TYRP_004739 [Tyrophagus putrescentiae]
MNASTKSTSESQSSIASAVCSNCNSRNEYLAHLENCLHSYCGPCFLNWRRQAFFNFVITCSICGRYSRRAFPSPKPVNSRSERRKIAEAFERVCQRNANSNRWWLISQLQPLVVLVVAYIAATLICHLNN